MKQKMIDAGWQTNGVYWWFEDTGCMSFRDALYYYRSAK